MGPFRAIHCNGAISFSQTILSWLNMYTYVSSLPKLNAPKSETKTPTNQQVEKRGD